MDIWVKKDIANYNLIVNAFREFKMPVFDMTEENFLHNSHIDVFTFGQAPVCIDLMTTVKGLDFDEAYAHSQIHSIESLAIRMVSYEDLLIAKKASGRPRDQDDIEKLRRKSE
jgi:hypothetical protein